LHIFNHSIEYGNYLKEKEARRNKKLEDQKLIIQNISDLSDGIKTNYEISIILGMTYPNLIRYKRLARDMGIDIKNVSPGRPQKPKIYCDKCNQIIKI